VLDGLPGDPDAVVLAGERDRDDHVGDVVGGGGQHHGGEAELLAGGSHALAQVVLRGAAGEGGGGRVSPYSGVSTL